MTFKGFVQTFQDWLASWTSNDAYIKSSADYFDNLQDEAGTNAYWNILGPETKNDSRVIAAHDRAMLRNKGKKAHWEDPFANFISGTLDEWVASLGDLENMKPEDAGKKLSEISAKVIEIFAASAAIDLAAGLLPNGDGVASSTNTKQLVKWLGFGAVLAAVAHDPVKIGLLRPYQDALETKFHNRRPDWRDMLKAYQQRSLSPTRITNVEDITDKVMDAIEAENSTHLDSYGATWGYQQSWIDIMKDAETRALTFGNLSVMARMGYFDRGMATFSLWGYGLDRRLMKPALDTLSSIHIQTAYKGFRSMVEPSYVQGLMDAADLTSYWNNIGVPADVQTWAMLRLTKQREIYAAKEAVVLHGKQRDLTKADWTTAYKDGIITLDDYKAKLKALGYDESEIGIYVKLADAKKTGTVAGACKHLPLSDYELAHRNGLITLDQVLARMTGEYCQGDIDLEKQLLEINDLTSDAPAQEKDLTVSQLTAAYADSLIDKAALTASLTAMGYDAAETAILITFADQKKGVTAAGAAKAVTAAGVAKARDLTLAQLTTAYIDNIIDEAAYTADLGSLGYDVAETDILLKLAQIKKKLPTAAGVKRLTLAEYVKAWKHSIITSDQVLTHMQGEYTADDIGLMKSMLAAGVA